MDIKTISVLRPLELFEVVNKLQNMINNESGLTQFIQFAKNMDEMRKKWHKAEERVKELEYLYKQENLEKSTLSRQVNELKIDIEIHYEKRLKAENERDKLQKQIEMFKKILEDKQSYTMNDEDRNFLLNTPNNNYQNYNSTKRLSHNPVDETGSLISDYTEDDLDIIDNDDLPPAPKSSERLPLHNNTRRCIRNRNPILSPQIINSPVGRSSKRQKGSLTRLDTSERKRSRTRSHDGPLNRESLNPGSAITAITTLKMSDDGRPLTLTSEIQHNSSTRECDELGQGNNKLEVSFVRPKAKKKRPSREFLQKSADESESADSDVFWSSETGGGGVGGGMKPLNQIDRRLLTPIVETPNILKLSKENLNKHNNERLKNVNSSPLITTANTKKVTSRKPHSFKTHYTINSEFCANCDKKTKFGKMVYKCRDCDMVVHPECKELTDRPCYLPIVYPLQGTISDYVTSEPPFVPSFLQYIVAEIESRGIGKEVGLYRVNGSDQQIKQLKEKLIKRHQLPDLRKINDVHVLCGFVKEFLNNLNEHLIKYDSWRIFANACTFQNDDEKAEAFKNAINDLPRPNRETLAFMILHLQKISQSPECKMGTTNLSYVLGPSLVGNSSTTITSATIIHEIKIQHQIVENLIMLPTQFYESVLSTNDAKLIKNAPNTPDVLRKSRTATVLSSLLGPAVNNNTPLQQRQNLLETPSRDQNTLRARRNYN